MNRFFIDQNFIKNNVITISGSDVNHIKNVLRKKEGDEIICFDGGGKEYLSRITGILKDQILLSIISVKSVEKEPKTGITLIQVLPKLGKMDDIIRKATELGVSKIIPAVTERSIAKSDKIERWKRITKEAAQQSGRQSVPSISPALPLKEVLESIVDNELKLIAFEGEKTVTLRSALKKNPSAGTVAVLIGPEGGFSAEEVSLAMEKGFLSVSLGRTILRTETAGPAAIAMILYEKEL